MENTKILERIGLTGGNSFLGSLVLKRFASSPSIGEVHIFDLVPPTVVSNKFLFHRIDLKKDEASFEIAAILSKNKITTFLHGALFSGPTRKPDHHEIESIGTFHVLNALAKAHVKRLIVHGATFVYDARPENPNFVCENFPINRQSNTKIPKFIKTRIDVENQIQDFADTYSQCSVTVLRFAPILGPTATNIRARYFFTKIIPKIWGYDPLVQFIHEDDAARAHTLAFLSNTKGGIFNIVGKGVLPLSTGIHLSGKIPIPCPSALCRSFFATGFSTKLWDLPHDIIPFFQYLCVADGKKAKQVLGFDAKYSSRQALKSVIESNRLREEGFPIPSSFLGEDTEESSFQDHREQRKLKEF